MQDEITDRIHTEKFHQIIGIHYISLGFAHLAVALKKPGMTEYLLRQRLAQSHQEDGPVNGMETDDILSN